MENIQKPSFIPLIMHTIQVICKTVLCAADGDEVMSSVDNNSCLVCK